MINVESKDKLKEEVLAHFRHIYNLTLQDILLRIERLFIQKKSFRSFNYVFSPRNSNNFSISTPPCFMQGNFSITVNADKAQANNILYKIDYILESLREFFENESSINLFYDNNARENRFNIYRKIANNYNFHPDFFSMILLLNKRSHSYFCHSIDKWTSSFTLNQIKNVDFINFNKVRSQSIYNLKMPVAIINQKSLEYFSQYVENQKECIFADLRDLEAFYMHKIFFNLGKALLFEHLSSFEISDDRLVLHGNSVYDEQLNQIQQDFAEHISLFRYANIRGKFDKHYFMHNLDNPEWSTYFQQFYLNKKIVINQALPRNTKSRL